MFSLDNFYTFFQSHYGYHKTKNLIWIFHPHGSKNLNDAIISVRGQTDPLKPISVQDWDQWPLDIKISRIMLMHDQEPFFKDYCADIYRNVWLGTGKKDLWENMLPEEVIFSRWASCYWPIFCHSEINSPDIEWLKSKGAIDCYYQWHGLISRDWFRHWRHHADLHHRDAWQQRFLLYVRDCSGTREYRTEVKNKLTRLKDQINSDWDSTRSISSDYSAKIIVEDAVNTAIHLVAETVFGQDKIHITEKIFKPMVMNQPFIVFAGPGTLKYLRDYGFQTFGDIWDERYDQISHAEERLNAIVDLITDLYDLSDKEFGDVMTRCQNIVEHNNRWFFSDEFEKILLKELHDNLQTALKKQQEYEISNPGGSFFYFNNSLKDRGQNLSDRANHRLQTVVSGIRKDHPDLYLKISGKYSWVKDIR